MATAETRIKALEKILLPPTKQETKIIVQLVGRDGAVVGTIEHIDGQWVHTTLISD